MIKKIPRKTFLAAHPKFPRSSPMREKSVFPEVFQSWVLTTVTTATSFEKHTHAVAAAMKALMVQMDYEPLFFGTDVNISWLRENDDNPASRKGVAYFSGIGIDRKFKAGLAVFPLAYEGFIPALLLLIRTNEILPYIYFTDANETMLGTFCQYGNLHLYALTGEISIRLQTILPAAGFVPVEGERCFDNFSTTPGIRGRRAF